MTFRLKEKPIRNILLDINGVLFDSGEEHPIEGSVDAMKRLVQHGFNFCLVTNECTTAKRLLAKKLNDFGYDMITPHKIISPGPVAAQYIIDKGLIPRLHVWDNVLEDFQPAIDRLQQQDAGGAKRPANCIVVGDIMTKLSRDFIDESLEIMLASPEKPQVITLGAGRYYKDSGRLRMDTGAFAAAFCYALGIDKPTCLGKPSPEFFHQALRVVSGGSESQESNLEQTIMIGDDIVSDVGGAQAMGMRAYLVKTGKYKPSDEIERGVKADGVFLNLAHAVEEIVRHTRTQLN